MEREKRENIDIIHFQRKPRLGSFSLENLFRDVREGLESTYNIIHYESKYYSTGILNRLLMSIDFVKHQKDVNHITGDINFSNIFLNRNKTVLTILDVGYLKRLKGLKFFIFKFFWITLPIKRAKYVTTISNSAKEEILKYSSCNPNKIKVVYVPIGKQFKYNQKVFNENKPVILQVGTGKDKNLLRLVEALKGINCHLKIIGSLNQEVLGLLKEFNIEYTNLVGISNEDVVKAYIESDILAFVSTHEGFGMPIVEANLTGRAVITSRAYSMPEVAGDGAMLIDPYNITEIREGILEIINNSKFREELIQKGFKNAKRFSIEKISKDYAEIYESIIK